MAHLLEETRAPMSDDRRWPDVTIPIEHAATCDAVLCWRTATRVALDRDGKPFAICEVHRPFARFMFRLPSESEDSDGG
jgi:hypothetical protein